MRVVIGGTFEYLHKGHRKLIDEAFRIGNYVIIGITADGFKKDVVLSFEERKNAVERYVKKFRKRYRIVEINDIYGPTLEEDFDVIIVSRETRENAEKINEERVKKGFKKMKIITISTVLAEDLLPINSTRIRNGDIDSEGKRLRPMIVKIGSENPSKIRAVKMVFAKIFNFEIKYIGEKVDSDVADQPFGNETIRGAINRAKKLKNCDYCIGIEAGLFYEEEIKKYIDRAYCVIIDKFGNFTVGHSGGFYYPSQVMRLVKSGMEVGEAMENISGIKDIKKKMGAIGYLSNGLIERHEFNAQAVLMAMIPRIRNELYQIF